MAWSTASRELLDTYRVAHHLSMPAAFTSPLNRALLTNPGIGRQSPTMARRKEKRRVSKEQLALAVRKNFNAAAVSESDVVVDMMYKVQSQGMFPEAVHQGGVIERGVALLILRPPDQAFRMRLAPGVAKKP